MDEDSWEANDFVETMRAYEKADEEMTVTIKASELASLRAEVAELRTARSELVGALRKDVTVAIERALATYTCHRTHIEGQGEGLPLVDKMCEPEATTITSGLEELELLGDHIFAEVDAALAKAEGVTP
jgi:hypothetical protein